MIGTAHPSPATPGFTDAASGQPVCTDPDCYAIGFTPHSKGIGWSNHQLRNSPPASVRDDGTLSSIYTGERSYD